METTTTEHTCISCGQRMMPDRDICAACEDDAIRSNGPALYVPQVGDYVRHDGRRLRVTSVRSHFGDIDAYVADPADPADGYSVPADELVLVDSPGLPTHPDHVRLSCVPENHQAAMLILERIAGGVHDDSFLQGMVYAVLALLDPNGRYSPQLRYSMTMLEVGKLASW